MENQHFMMHCRLKLQFHMSHYHFPLFKACKDFDMNILSELSLNLRILYLIPQTEQYIIIGLPFQALKRDFCRSLLARCELLCEDLLQAEEEQG